MHWKHSEFNNIVLSENMFNIQCTMCNTNLCLWHGNSGNMAGLFSENHKRCDEKKMEQEKSNERL